MSGSTYITDKDGGIATELRSDGAIPVYMPGTGDGNSRQYWSEQINISASGDNTIHTVPSGKRFFIHTILFTVPQAGSAVRLKSGAGQNISGVIRPPALTPVFASNERDAVLMGKYIDDNFIISTSGDRFVPYVGGFVTGYDEAV